MRQLLDEERISSCSAKDKACDLRRDFSSFEDRLHKLGACPSGELIQSDLAVVRLAAPGVRVLRPVEENQQNGGIGQPPDQVVKKFL